MPVTTPELESVPAPVPAAPASAVSLADAVDATPAKQPTKNVVLTQIDQALEGALAQGVTALDQQIRYILAHSQALGRRSSTESVSDQVDKPLSANHARLTVLVALADENSLGSALNPDQIEQVAADIAQIGDDGLRLLLNAQLAAYRMPQAQAAVLRDAWKRLNQYQSFDLEGEWINKTLPEYASPDEDRQDISPDIRARILHYLALLQASDANESGARSGIIMEMYRIAKSIASAEGRLRSLAALAVNVPLVSSRKIYERVLSDLVKVRSDTLRSTTLVALTRRIPPELEADIIATALAIRAPVTRTRALTALAQTLPERIELTTLAIETVSGIAEEEERIEAFATVVPGLYHHQSADETSDDYPTALKAALTIAVNFSKRSSRARALVLLAPYLTRDLQTEALAAVNGLANERERASLLAELAPHLPPVALTASLSAAHTMREQDSRVHVLTVLARHLPEDAEIRSQTLLDALAAATNLPNAFERVRALVALGDILPDPLQNQAYTNAVESARLVENENARARALSLLGAHVSSMLMRRVLEAIYELRDTQQRLNALTSIVARLPLDRRSEVLSRMLEIGMALPFAYQRARAVISSAPHLTPEHLGRAFEIAASINEAHDRASALIALAQVQPPHSRAETIAEAWTQVGKIEDGYDRASALVAIAPLLPAALRPELEARIGMVVGSIMDDYDQASALCLLAPLLADTIPPREAAPLPSVDLLLAQAVFTALRIPSQTERARCLAEIAPTWAAQDVGRRFSLWREVAQQLKSLPLADVLLCLSVLMPVIHAIAGDDQLLKVAHVLGIQQRKSDEP